MDMEMKGGIKGFIKLDLKNGQIIEGDYKMDVDAKIGANGIKIPMTMKGKYTMNAR
jgi:hypothetical protein